MSDPVVVGEQYYILASEVAALPKLVLKHDDAFLVADRRGDLPNQPQSNAVTKSTSRTEAPSC